MKKYSSMSYEEFITAPIDEHYLAGRWIETRSGGKVWVFNGKWWFIQQHRKRGEIDNLVGNE